MKFALVGALVLLAFGVPVIVNMRYRDRAMPFLNRDYRNTHK
jgi:hypothetical protein